MMAEDVLEALKSELEKTNGDAQKARAAAAELDERIAELRKQKATIAAIVDAADRQHEEAKRRMSKALALMKS